MGKSYQHLLWEEISREKVQDCKIFDYYKAKRVSPSGYHSDITLLDSPNSVTVISIVENDEGEECFLMVRQFRHGTSEVTLEFPAGLVDAGEEPKVAALREFAEETGYFSDSIVELGHVCPNPAYLNNFNYTFLIKKPEYRGLEKFDSGEFLELVKYPVKDFDRLVGEGEFANGMMMISYLFYLKWLRGASK
ncbi:MAG: NUDIX hydrolase [Spirochaetales bacterium]|nr:NUDIX hydrolase [Spirochaetales bacterium]